MDRTELGYWLLTPSKIPRRSEGRPRGAQTNASLNEPSHVGEAIEDSETQDNEGPEVLENHLAYVLAIAGSEPLVRVEVLINLLTKLCRRIPRPLVSTPHRNALFGGPSEYQFGLTNTESRICRALIELDGLSSQTILKHTLDACFDSPPALPPERMPSILFDLSKKAITKATDGTNLEEVTEEIALILINGYQPLAGRNLTGRGSRAWYDSALGFVDLLISEMSSLSNPEDRVFIDILLSHMIQLWIINPIQEFINASKEESEDANENIQPFWEGAIRAILIDLSLQNALYSPSIPGLDTREAIQQFKSLIEIEGSLRLLGPISDIALSSAQSLLSSSFPLKSTRYSIQGDSIVSRLINHEHGIKPLSTFERTQIILKRGHDREKRCLGDESDSEGDDIKDDAIECEACQILMTYLIDWMREFIQALLLSKGDQDLRIDELIEIEWGRLTSLLYPYHAIDTLTAVYQPGHLPLETLYESEPPPYEQATIARRKVLLGALFGLHAVLGLFLRITSAQDSLKVMKDDIDIIGLQSMAREGERFFMDRVFDMTQPLSTPVLISRGGKGVPWWTLFRSQIYETLVHIDQSSA